MNKLTKKSRWMLYLSLFISGLVIFTTIFYFVSAKNSTDSQTRGIVLAIIIIIAVLAVLSMLASRIKMKKSTKNLSPEYFEAYEDISDRLGGSTMSNFERRETMNDILDMFMLANRDNRPVSDVVGNDIDYFINQIQNSFGYRSSIFFNLLTGVQYCVIYLFMIQISTYIENIDSSYFAQQINVSMIFLLSLMAFIGLPFLFYFKRKNKMLLMLVIPISILVLFIAAMETIYKYFMDLPLLYNLAEGEINAFRNIWFVLFWILLFVGSILFKWLQRRVSIKKL